MSKDEFDSGKDQEFDSWEERETEIISPTSTLIQEARRTAISNNEDTRVTKPPAANPPMEDAPKPKIAVPSRTNRAPVRIRLESSARTPHQSRIPLLLIGVALLSFLLGYLPLSIYSNHQREELDRARENLKADLGIYSGHFEHALDELGQCVRDFEQLSGSTAPMGLAPGNSLVDKKRAKKETAASALAEKQNAIFTQLDKMNKPALRSGKRWKNLKKYIEQFHKLTAQSKRAEREYQSALRKSMTPTVGAADIKMTARNKKRAAYLKEANSLLNAPRGEQTTPTP